MTDLTDLASVKAWIPIPVTNTDDDALLTTLVTEASTFVESWLNRDLALTDYVETRSGQGMREMMMFQQPIVSVASVTVDGIVIPVRPPLGPGTYAGQGGYSFDDRMLYLSGYYCFTRGAQNVVVGYSAGYATTPPDIQQATNMIVADWYKNARGARLGVLSTAIEAQTITYAKDPIPPRALVILQQYRRVAPFL